MAVAQLYHHIAPRSEMSIISKPLIRLLKSHSEVQNIVLSNVATMSADHPVSWSFCYYQANQFNISGSGGFI